MTITDVAKKISQDGAVLIRYRKDSYKETGTAHYDCKPMFTGSKRGWIAVDSMTAGAITAVFNALRPDLQAKFNNIPLGKLVEFCWRHVK